MDHKAEADWRYKNASMALEGSADLDGRELLHANIALAHVAAVRDQTEVLRRVAHQLERGERGNEVPTVCVESEPASWREAGMVAEHTRGPWRRKRPDHIARTGPSGAFVVFGGPDGTTLVCQGPWAEGNPAAIQEQEANGNLITAAPDLLTACEGALNEIQRIGAEPGSIERQYQNAAMRYLKAAIAQAKGGGSGER